MPRPAVLMTDPRGFAIKAGAHPATRNPDGSLKTVDARKAAKQWRRYAEQLEAAGLEVYVVPAVPGLTGMVFAGHAGKLKRARERIPIRDKVFYVSNFAAPHRRGERGYYIDFMRGLGFPYGDVTGEIKFEGEADLIAVGEPGQERYVFTYGKIEYEFGDMLLSDEGYCFRSEERLFPKLQRALGGRPVVKAELRGHAFPTGDSALLAAPGALFVYPPAFTPGAMGALREHFGRELVVLSDEDAQRLAANSFVVETERGRFAFVPEGVSDGFQHALAGQGLQVQRVELSEFVQKSGGGPKSLVLDIGAIIDDPSRPAPADDMLELREKRRYSTLARAGQLP